MRRFCMALLTDLKKAKRGAIAKAISIMENDPKEARQLIKKNLQNIWKINRYRNYRTCRSWQIIFNQQVIHRDEKNEAKTRSFGS